MKLRTSELTGAALDRAVALALNLPDAYLNAQGNPAPFSQSWSHGGPIIEREGMLIAPDPCGWEARHPGDDGDSTEAVGPTPLVAAMRCYVKSQFGDVVDMPQELQGEQ